MVQIILCTSQAIYIYIYIYILFVPCNYFVAAIVSLLLIVIPVAGVCMYIVESALCAPSSLQEVCNEVAMLLSILS